ncbi:hypothetical protein BELL_1241g00030 [Botrytis elliptica]|uniref:Uncharacterized protein n=1 Tax=Botrytis elliptica TaxID=278938 RepID=A0A4Z1IIZ2_9HELO|nr:hypothetical protein BELL_1241g00030 [Botrytis elliptica]
MTTILPIDLKTPLLTNQIARLRILKLLIDFLTTFQNHNRFSLAKQAKERRARAGKKSEEKWKSGIIPWTRMTGRLELRKLRQVHSTKSHHKWIDKSGAIAKREAEELLNVHFKTLFQMNMGFRIWPELSKGKDMTADSEEGKTTLARAHDFVQFWLWYDKGNDCSPGTRKPLRKCLEWFKSPNDCSYYNQYLKDRAVQSVSDT